MFNGGSGFVTIIAPLPAFDCVEFPQIFVAITFAKTLDPQVKLYGDAYKVATGMLHDLDDITVEEIGLQQTDSVVYVKLSLYLIQIVYAVIVAPLAAGKLQETVT